MREGTCRSSPFQPPGYAKYIVADDRHALVLHTTGYATDQVDGGVYVSRFKLDSQLEL
jgi:hypothetical protein